MTAKFTRDGIVQLDNGERQVSASDPFDILRWMDERIELDEGITFLEIMDCLSPWSAIVGTMGNFDFDAWHAAASLCPGESLPANETLKAVEIRGSISVDRDDLGVAEVSIEWNAFGRLMEPDGLPGHETDVIGLTLSPPARYSRLPVTMPYTASVDDVMCGGSSPPWNKLPAVHPTEDGGVTSFTVAPTVLMTIIYGLLADVTAAGTPAEAACKLERVAERAARLMLAGETPKV